MLDMKDAYVMDSNENVYDTVGCSQNSLKNIGLV